MFRAICVLPLTLLLAGGSALAQTPEEKGLELAKKVDAANQGFKGEKNTSEMKLINAHGDVVTRKMTMRSMEMNEDGDRSLVEFQWPADVKGTRLLTWTHKKDSDDQWLYLPSLKRVKRISSKNKSGSFMGSEFAYEDIASQEVEKYGYKLLGEEKLDGRDVWKLERYPKDKSSGYKRQVLYIDKEYLNATKIEYYDRKDELLKTGKFSDWKKFGKLWRMGEIEMFNAQTKKKSILTISDRELNIEFDEDDFESDNLKD